MATDEILAPEIARAARALSRVSAKHLAAEAGIAKHDLRDFERGNRELRTDDQRRLREALAAHGVVFIADDEAGGAGVRRKFNASKVKRLHMWEGEGGPVANDHV